MRIATTLAALVCTACAGSAPAPDSREERSSEGELTRADFALLDDDRDARLDDEEFFRSMLRYYDVWDTDEDGQLTSSELATGIFATWDTDRDQLIDRAEYRRGARLFFPNHIVVPLARFDADRNGALDPAESHNQLRTLGLLTAYDADANGRVTDLELSDALFAGFDADHDGGIDSREWRFN